MALFWEPGGVKLFFDVPGNMPKKWFGEKIFFPQARVLFVVLFYRSIITIGGL